MNNDNESTTTVTLEPNPFAERAAAEAAKPKKASVLSLITKQRRRRPFFGVIYGPPGVGKSSFAAESPSPIFIPCERGLDQISKVARFPTPKTLAEFGSYLKAVQEEPNDFQTLVIDTGDALDLLIAKAVCEEGKVDSLDEYGGGFQRGVNRVREYWARLLARLTQISEERTVLIVCHSHLRTINDPMLGTAYDVHELKIQQKSVELIRQSVDLIAFARIATTIAKDTAKAKKGRGLVSGDRELYTQPTTGIESKNRFSLESPMEFSWSALQAGVDKFYDT